jgi:CBS domain-containing protein
MLQLDSLRPRRRALRRRREERNQRLTTRRAVRRALVSLAGLLGQPVYNQVGAEVGRLADLVARWGGDAYPPVTGLVVRVGGRLAFVPVEQVARLGHRQVELRSARLDLRDVERRQGEVLLAKDVLDHQLVDTDGIKVIRAADLYLAPLERAILLVGVDVSLQTLLRRLGPARFRPLPTPDQVIDWAAIEPFGTQAGQVQLRTTSRALQRLRPGELADLLEDLGRHARQELLDSLEPQAAADALEEMDPDELDALLREVPDERASTLLARMEPDEAVDALRELDADEREGLLGRMPPEKAAQLRELLAFPEDRAGGFMNADLVCVPEDQTVAEVRQRLRQLAGEQPDLGTVLVTDGQGRLVALVSMLELLVAEPGQRMAELAGPSEPVTVGPDAALDDVVDGLVEARESTLVVVDEAGRPLGRILADDVIDALLPERGRLHFPRLLR